MNQSFTYVLLGVLALPLWTFAQTAPLGIQERLDGPMWADAQGREVVLRGFNVSGSVKLIETGFKPFKNLTDARLSLGKLKASGANSVRFTIAWEGTNPAPRVLDMGYLSEIKQQMRQALQLGLFVVLDWHQDLYSRHLFRADSWYTGNGAPAWATVPGREYCGPVCLHWSQHNVTDKAVRRAFRAFWENQEVQAAGAPRRLQDEFLWQLGETVRFLRQDLPAIEDAYFLGVDPFNEPVDGGMGELSPAEWDNQILWPFYKKVRHVMDGVQAQRLVVFAEPLVFWNVNVGIPPRTGGGHLKSRPGPGFAFNSHYYDAKRLGPLVFSSVRSGQYVKAMQEIRQEAKFLGLPAFVSEFGAPIGGSGVRDTRSILAGMYQALDLGGGRVPEKSGRVALGIRPLSGTQWHWDIYRGRHDEAVNGDVHNRAREGDAWNGEDFSVLDRGGAYYTLPRTQVERAYPRAVAGRIQSFMYQDGKRGWHAIWDGHRALFNDAKFAWLAWLPGPGGATDLFIPPHFDPHQSTRLEFAGGRNESAYILVVERKLDAVEKARLGLALRDQLAQGMNPLVWEF